MEPVKLSIKEVKPTAQIPATGQATVKKPEEPKVPKRIPLAAGMFRRIYGFLR